MFYSVVIPSLIDSIQDFYFLHDRSEVRGGTVAVSLQTNPHIVIPLLFCTLAEVALEDFLHALMRKQGLPLPATIKLLKEHLSGRQRRLKLFPRLTSRSWDDALAELRQASQIDFPKTFAFYREVNHARNRFLHAGAQWAIKPNHPQGCIDHIWPLLKLFVGLHNRFVCVQHPSENL
jgi:hypothetical protein